MPFAVPFELNMFVPFELEMAKVHLRSNGTHLHTHTHCALFSAFNSATAHNTVRHRPQLDKPNITQYQQHLE